MGAAGEDRGMAQGLRLLLLKDRPQMALVAQEKMSTLEEF